MSATPQQVRLWSDEVAADPGSRAFLPLAEHYRAAGRRDAALRLVIRGLERHTHDVEAHYLLGLLYRDGGELVKAFDEWDIALALSPEHQGSRREIGLLCAARGEWELAVRHLEKAREGDFEDEEVRLALEDAWTRVHGAAAPPVELPAEIAPPEAPVAASAPVATTPPVAPAPAETRAPAETVTAPSASSSEGGGWGGGREFDALLAEFGALGGERGIVGAVMLDAQGYVVAGGMMVSGRDRGPEIAAVLSGASTEAERAVRHLKLGAWKGILVETPDAVVRLSPTGDGGMVAVAGRRDVPMGWVLRVAARARDAAARFLAAMGGR
ncbi:MAG TPA: roadblock/LC7 domain-containing protein [Longimicrobium sp.]|nr:roadblock/LC7 domain-containing protein [Longimicrobium sp.]